MKKALEYIFLTLVCLSTACIPLPAQHEKVWQWVNQLGGSGWDMVGGIACDDLNNLYVAGNFSGTFYGNNKNIHSEGGQDIFIACFNEKGNITDLINAGGLGYDQLTCIVATNNQLILGGSVNGNATFKNLTSDGSGERLFIASSGSKGKFRWITSMIPNGEASLFLINADKNNNIYAAGVFSGTLAYEDSVIKSHGKKDIFIVKLNSSGTIKQLISFGSQEDDIPSAMAVTDSGEVYLSGTYKKSFEVDNIFLSTGTGKSHSFILALNRELKTKWKKEIHDDEYLRIASLTHDSSGNLYAGGSYSLNMYLDDNERLSSQGYTDCFLLKYSERGEKLWNKTFGTWYYDHTNKIITDKLGGIIVTGSIGDTLTLDSLTITAQSDNSALALQFSPSGNIVWGDCISGEGSYFGKDVMLDSKGNLYFSGGFSGLFNKKDEPITSKGDQDIFFARYYNCELNKAEIIGDSIICPGSTVDLSVKPGYYNILWNDSVSGTTYLTANKTGLYTVTMFDKKGCFLADSLNLIAAKASDFSLGNDQLLPLESTFLLKAPKNYKNFLWQDFSDKTTFYAEAENGNPGKYQYWLSATDSSGCIAMDTIAIEFYPEAQWIDPSNIQLSYYPNPVKELLNWSISNTSSCQLILDVTADDGRPIMKEYIPYYEPGTLMELNLGNLPAGMYYLQIKNASNHGSKAVCIVKQ